MCLIRKCEAEFVMFLEISIGSAFKVETQLIIVKEFDCTIESDFKQLISQNN